MSFSTFGGDSGEDARIDEYSAEVSNGIDKGKSRTLLENASTLGFIDKVLG